MSDVASIGTQLPCRSDSARPSVGDTGLDSVVHQRKSHIATRPTPTRAATQVDIDEVRDFFTSIELIGYEEIGVAGQFGGVERVDTPASSGEVSLPQNPGSHLMAKADPRGAAGVTQCVELFRQLRGEAVYQVDGARIALAHNIGGPTPGSAVTIPKGPGSNGK